MYLFNVPFPGGDTEAAWVSQSQGGTAPQATDAGGDSNMEPAERYCACACVCARRERETELHQEKSGKDKGLSSLEDNRRH